MSVEAISWALNLAPVPADRGGQPSSTCKFVLVGLANHAGPDGTGAFPSVATLVRYTGLSERTVRTCLDRLEAEGIIQPCDPDIVAARIKRAERRPKGWDLNLAMVRDDLAAADIGVLEHQFPGLGARLDSTGQAGPDAANHGVQPPHPGPGSGEPVDNSADGVRQPHPAYRTGCNQRTDGVQPVPARGAAVAPEPYQEPSREPPAAAPAREPPPAARGRSAGEYFTALGDRWQLTGRQRARLIPAVMAALAAGWTPHGLAAFTGANTAGVRNPYAVLAAWLSPGELPRHRGSVRPGRRGAASAIRPPGCSGSTATHRARARAANRWPPRAGGLSREGRFELRPPFRGRRYHAQAAEHRRHRRPSGSDLPAGSHGEGAVATTDSDHPSVSASCEFAPHAEYAALVKDGCGGVERHRTSSYVAVVLPSCGEGTRMPSGTWAAKPIGVRCSIAWPG